ncbi:hypothetical protein DOT28_14840 [Listeria monocytogenes]|nr:hypothetical protein [Listeria monocytogenes]EAC7182503.1 hypothetical protein [Listeria monocytogenes]EAC8000876.1 hypothetical protein [Listeria monocytogenes]EAD4096307.1 hypothetical protein [Listeria monocytogenes]EAD9140638.1 hypothetical protein [Listeria monocytogenes]
MLIHITSSNLFQQIVMDKSNDQNKIFYSTKLSGSSVGFKPKSFLKHTYLLLTSTGTFYHTVETNNNKSLKSPIGIQDDINLIPVDIIMIRTDGSIKIT